MSVKVNVPPALRDLTGGAVDVEASGLTISSLFEALEAKYPGGKSRLLEPDGRLKLHVTVFVNGYDARRLNGMDTPLSDGDLVTIVAAMAGG
jgi:MoaD family protein